MKNAKKEDLQKLKASNGIKIMELDGKYENYWRNNDVKPGTIITAINDTKVNSVDDAQDILKNSAPNEPLRIEIINTQGEKERYNFR